MRLSPFSFSGAVHPLNPILKQRLSRTEYTLTAHSGYSREKGISLFSGRNQIDSSPFRAPLMKASEDCFSPNSIHPCGFYVTHRGIAKLGLDSKKGIKRTPEHCKEFDVLCWAVSTENGMYYSLLKQFLLSTKNNEERHLLNDFTGKVWKC